MFIAKPGINQNNKTVHYYFNYSDKANSLIYPYKNGKELLSGDNVVSKSTLQLAPWDVKIIEVN